MRYLVIISAHINTISKWAIFLLAAVSTVVGGLNVLNRSLIHYPIPWVDALIRYSLIWIVFLGFPVLVKEKKLISVDVIASHFSGRSSKFFHLLSYFSILIFSLIVLIKGWEIMTLPIVKSQTVATLGISKFWIYASIPTGFILTLLHLAVLFSEELTPFGQSQED